MSELSGFLKLNSSDFVKGLVSAVIAGVVLAVWPLLSAIVQAPDFDVFAVHWGVVLGDMLRVAINAGFATFVGYMGKNLLTDSKGDIHTPMGKIKA